MRGILLPMALLSLAACGSNDAAGNDGSASRADADVSGAVAEPQVPPQLAVDNSQQMVPVDLPQPTAISAIPDAFRGRWGMVPNDCVPGRADNKGLMTVSADSLTFYESRATPSSIEQVTPTRIKAMLAYRGEGQTWRRPTSLTLLDAGKSLVREDGDPAGAQTYSKCPETNGK